MPNGVFVDDKGKISLREYEEQDLQSDDVRIRTELASIKHGTFFHLYSGLSPFQDRRFDQESRLFVDVASGNGPSPMRNQFVGNMVVGKVIRVGENVKELTPGCMVYGYGRICETVTNRETEFRPLEEPLTAADALCLDPARIAYAAIRDAGACLGDNVAVFGLGAIGLLLIQMLKQCGCLNIIAVDPIKKRRCLAESYGAHRVLDPSHCDVATSIRDILGKGVDIAIEASGSYKALGDAIRAVRNCARVVCLGYYIGKDSELELGAEWLHNRVDLICSMPDWGNPMRGYPLWDNERLAETVKRFFINSFISSKGILDPIVEVKDAADAIKAIWEDPSESIKLGVRFN